MYMPIASIKEMVRLSKSRLSLKIVFWIFLSIVAIEAALLVPSVGRQKQKLLAQIEEVSSGKVTWLLMTYPDATGEELLEHTSQLRRDPMLQMILGGAVYRADGELVGTFGEIPALSFQEASQGAGRYLRTAEGDRYDTTWTASLTTGEYSIVMRHDAATIQPALSAYILRIIGLVLVISAFVTLVMMLILGSNLIAPILKLRRDLALAGDAVRYDRPSPEFDSTTIKRRDELGDVVNAFEQMFQQICVAIAERKQAEADLMQCNQQMRQYLQQVEKVTTAAAAVEEGTFAPEGLTEVAKREDELGRLARVFQEMAEQVKAREDRLKQQITDLKIEIDREKRLQDVAKITQSGEFREMQEEVGKLDLDEFWS
jgi:HAMP domain-containing protein